MRDRELNIINETVNIVLNVLLLVASLTSLGAFRGHAGAFTQQRKDVIWGKK